MACKLSVDFLFGTMLLTSGLNVGRDIGVARPMDSGAKAIIPRGRRGRMEGGGEGAGAPSPGRDATKKLELYDNGSEKTWDILLSPARHS